MAKEFIDGFIEDDGDLIDDGKCDKVVYLHRRADDGLPFYVGIGRADRPYVISKRNEYWTNVYSKHGRTVELLHTGLSIADAKRIEIELIAKFRAEYPGLMTNLSDGGEGSFGLFGEDGAAFKGFSVGVSLDNKFFIVLDGERSIEEAGFINSAIYACIKGHTAQHRRMRWYRHDVVDRDQFTGLTEIFHASELGIDFNAPEHHHSFLGFSVGVSLDNKFFIVLQGGRSIEEAGFLPALVYACINGHREQHRRMCWSRYNAVDRSQFAGLTEIFHASELGRILDAPEYHNKFLGFSVGISKCRTKFIILAGNVELAEAGFNPGNVSQCILGQRKSHKNFYWHRMTAFNPADFAGMSPVDQRSAERLEEFKI